jgi:hypothetical protein
MTAITALVFFITLLSSAILFFVLWPRDLKRVLRNTAIAFVVLAGFGAVSWHQCAVDQTSVNDVRSKVSRELPLGSTEEKVRAFVRHQGEFEPEAYTAEASLFLRQQGIPPGTKVLATIYRDTGPPWALGMTDIKVYFLLDSEGRLTEIIIDKVHTFL